MNRATAPGGTTQANALRCAVRRGASGCTTGAATPSQVNIKGADKRQAHIHNSIRTWDLVHAGGDLPLFDTRGSPLPCTTFRFTKGSRFIIAAGAADEALMYDLKMRRVERAFQARTGTHILATALTPCDKYLAASFQGWVRALDGTNRTASQPLRGMACSTSPAVRCRSGPVSVFMVHSALEVAQLGDEEGVAKTALEYHPTERHQLAVGSQSGTVRVVDTMTTRTAALLPGESDAAWGLESLHSEQPRCRRTPPSSPPTAADRCSCIVPLSQPCTPLLSRAWHGHPHTQPPSSLAAVTASPSVTCVFVVPPHALRRQVHAPPWPRPQVRPASRKHACMPAP